MINAERILLLISSTLFLSYLSDIMYNKTRIPDIVWLMVSGIVLGPLFGVFNVRIFMSIFDLMLLVTVALFSFSTGISFNAQQIFGNVNHAFTMALLTFIAVTFSVGLMLNYFLSSSFTLITGFLLGAMVAGIDSISVSSLISSLGRENKGLGESGPFLQLESTLSDPIKVFGVLIIIKMILLTDASPRAATWGILFTLIVAVLLGAGSGLIWGEIISRLRDRPLNYMMTIAVIFPLYVLSDIITEGGGGPISVFLFGAVLMNYGYVTKLLNMNRRSRIDRRKIKEYQDEITFLIKAMFFVYLGMVMQFQLRLIEISILISVMIIVVRYFVVSILGIVYGVNSKHIAYTRFFFIEGASSLVLTQFIAKYDPTGKFFTDPELFTIMVIPIVVLSIFFSSIIAPIMATKQTTPKPEEKPIEKPVEASTEADVKKTNGKKQ